MTDGRIYTVEDEIDELHEELGVQRRRRDSIERAWIDGRMVNEPEHEAALRRARQRVRELERELAAKLAETHT
jgi:hypothetical protein